MHGPSGVQLLAEYPGSQVNPALYKLVVQLWLCTEPGYLDLPLSNLTLSLALMILSFVPWLHGFSTSSSPLVNSNYFFVVVSTETSFMVTWKFSFVKNPNFPPPPLNANSLTWLWSTWFPTFFWLLKSLVSAQSITKSHIYDRASLCGFLWGFQICELFTFYHGAHSLVCHLLFFQRCWEWQCWQGPYKFRLS